MARFEEQKLYIGGRYVEASSGATFETINPANGEVLAKVQRASREDVERAVQSAVEGQKVWAAMTAMQRSRILRRAVDILRERNDELAALETLDTGKPLAETRSVDIVTGADVLEYYAGLVPAIEGEQIPLRETSFVYTRREPLGVVAGIGAWNYPVQIALWKSAPALAAGNAMIFKPSEVTPLTALKLAEIYTEAGVPDGVFNVLTGSGREVGQWLTEHPLIEKISFTGGTSTGKKVMASASSSSLKEVTMEPGRQVPADHLPRRRPRPCRRHRRHGQLLQLRPGLHQRHPGVHPPFPAGPLRSQGTGARAAHPSRRPAGREHQLRPAGQLPAHGKRARLHRVRQGAEGSPAVRRRACDRWSVRQWRLRRADRVHRLPRRHDHRPRGNLRPGDEHPGL